MVYDASNVPLTVTFKNNGEKAIKLLQDSNFVISLEPEESIKRYVENSEELLMYLVLGNQISELSVEVEQKDEEEVIPEITSLNASIVPGLEEGNSNVNTGATVATLSTQGGTSPYVYSLNEDEVNGADNGSFVISEANLNVGNTALTMKEYKVSLKVTDKNNKTATKNITISVGTPAITTLNVEPVAELTAPIEAETVVANLSAEGGIAPYTYTLKDSTGDNTEFKIDGTTVKTVGSIDSEATKNITVVVTDKNSSTKEQSAEISVAVAV